MQHTVHEAKSSLYTKGCKNVESLAKSQQQVKSETSMDDFDRNGLLCGILL